MSLPQLEEIVETLKMNIKMHEAALTIQTNFKAAIHRKKFLRYFNKRKQSVLMIEKNYKAYRIKKLVGVIKEHKKHT